MSKKICIKEEWEKNLKAYRPTVNREIYFAEQNMMNSTK